VAHRCGFASNDDPLGIALARTDEMLDNILNETNATEFELYLSDNYTNNFRYSIDPQYKANRKAARPVHLLEIKDHLYDKWNAQLSLGMEADDSLGIRQSACDVGTSVICTIDKDLMQIPGLHYNFVKKEFHTVEYIDGIRQLYLQLIIGDTSDNIKSIDRLGPVKAGKLLNHVTDEIEMFNIVRKLYNDDARLLKNGKLLYIRRVDDEMWEFPCGK